MVRQDGLQISEGQTYLGETFWQVRPPDSQLGKYHSSQPVTHAPQIKLGALNHASLGALDVQALAEFYTNVLDFQALDRPNFPFDGAWLQGGNLTLHIIQEDPSVPRHALHWQDQYKTDPETWYIRRGNHLAFEVDDATAMEKRLQYFGIEYTKAIVPDTDAVQLFFFDLHGNGVEVGSNYGEVVEMLRKKKQHSNGSNGSSGTNGSAISP